MNLSTFFLLSLCYFGVLVIEPAASTNGGPIRVKVKSETGEQYNLKLIKAGEDVLHPNIKVISTKHNEQTGQLSFHSWDPSSEEIQAAHDIYVDHANLAAIRFRQNENGEHEMEGVVDGRKLVRRNGKTVLSESPNNNQTDYIDLGRTITHSEGIQTSAPTNAVVEIAIVCDKDFGDLFQHDRRKILDYFTVYFWDINMRYKTLPSSNISFRITSVTVISNAAGQPFIEQARAADGRASHGRILPLFASWMYEQIPNLPKFDMAAAITNTNLEGGGGVAYVKAACWVHDGAKRHLGTLVFDDNGGWGSLLAGAHEIGHTLGAPHDADENFPGGCEDRGYIMSGANELRWFFSTCSDRVIGEFVSSNEAACLRRIDESGTPPISPDFSSVLPPSMDEQCRLVLKRPTAFVPDHKKNNCTETECWVPNDNGWWIWSLPSVDNSPCGDDGERCFRGRCRKQSSLIMNVATGKCMRPANAFRFGTPIDMVDCVRPGTPLDRFVINEENDGKKLATPWNSPDAKENGDKCIYTGDAEGDALWTDRCDSGYGSYHGFDFLDVGSGEFLLQHRPTKRCAKPSTDYIRTYKNCDTNDRTMRWKLQ